MRKFLFLFFSVLVFGVLNYGIYQKETLKEKGKTVFLELRTVDPRSLIQGDYMRLAYDLEITLDRTPREDRGPRVVVSLTPENIGSFARFYKGEALAPNEVMLHCHLSPPPGSLLRMLPSSFLFQEGHQTAYAQAKYGIFKVDADGTHLLVGLADEKQQEIKPS